MFKNIRIRNYQSLKDVELKLYPFTVIVGATDSGKSAFFRAISTLISNKRGSDFIRHGEKVCTIEAELEQGKLVLQRGKGTADNFYEITENGVSEKYTKLGGSVPEEVSKFLRIPAKDPVNIASQFDKPYLLDSKEYGPSEVARILGALTNVNIIFEGARESKRQKAVAAATLKTRGSDLESTELQLTQYSNLETEDETVTKVEGIVAEAEKAEVLSRELQNTIDVISQATNLQRQLSADLNFNIPDISELENLQTNLGNLQVLIRQIRLTEDELREAKSILSVDLPNADELDMLLTQTKTLESLLQAHSNSEKSKAESESVVGELATELVVLEEEFKKILEEEGTCPTCGQQIQ